jgi:nucleolar complex protein 2
LGSTATEQQQRLASRYSSQLLFHPNPQLNFNHYSSLQMGKKLGKSTKKFQEKHLGRVIEQRRNQKKVSNKRKFSETKKLINKEKNINPHTNTLIKKPKSINEVEEEEEAEEEKEEEEEKVQQKQPIKLNNKSNAKANNKPANNNKAAARTDSKQSKDSQASKSKSSVADLDVDDFLNGKFFDEPLAALENREEFSEEEEKLDEEDLSSEEDEDVSSEGEEQSMDEDSEEENEELDEEALEKEIKEHEKAIKQLAKQDPEFYQHLQQDDPELLQFGEESDESEGEEAETGESQLISEENWNKLSKSVVTGPKSVGNLKKIVKLFRFAAHINDESEENGENQLRQQYKNSKLLQEIIRFSVKQLPAVFHSYFNEKSEKNSANQAKIYSNLPAFKSLGPILKSYLGNYLHLLNTTLENKLLRFFLTYLAELLPFFNSFHRYLARLISVLVKIWSNADKFTRIDAFLRLRELCLALPGKSGALESVLKATYLAFVRSSKFSSLQSSAELNFLLNCVAEFYSLDAPTAYLHGFVYIRQLAIHVRNALLSKQKESYKSVYNWQFIWCLRCWAKILKIHSANSTTTTATTTEISAKGGANKAGGKAGGGSVISNLSALIYPFVQICQSVLSLLPATRYFPLRLHVCRLLIELLGSVNIYIPLSTQLISIFSAVELTKKPANSSKKVNDINFVLKVSEKTTQTKGYQEQLLNISLDLLLKYYAIYSYSVAFPELILYSQRALKKFSKVTKIQRIRKQIQQTLGKFELNSAWLIAKRNNYQFSPQSVLEKGLSALSTFQSSEKNPELSPLDKFIQQISKENGAEEQKLGQNEPSWNRLSDLEVEKGPKKGPKKGQEGAGSGGESEEFELGASESEEEAGPQKKKAKKSLEKGGAEEKKGVEKARERRSAVELSDEEDLANGKDELQDLVLSDSDEEIDGSGQFMDQSADSD